MHAMYSLQLFLTNTFTSQGFLKIISRASHNLKRMLEKFNPFRTHLSLFIKKKSKKEL